MLSQHDKDTLEDMIAGTEGGLKDVISALIEHERNRAECYRGEAQEQFTEAERAGYTISAMRKDTNATMLEGILDKISSTH